MKRTIIIHHKHGDAEGKNNIFKLNHDSFSSLTNDQLSELINFLKTVRHTKTKLKRPEYPQTSKLVLPNGQSVSAYYYFKMNMRDYIAQWGYQLPEISLVSVPPAVFITLASYLENLPKSK